MSELFNPSNEEYKKVEDLPEEHQEEFVDVPEEQGGGFVEKKAMEEMKVAEDISDMVDGSLEETSIDVLHQKAFFEKQKLELRKTLLDDLQKEKQDVLVDRLEKEALLDFIEKEKQERIAFPGIDARAYEKIKASEEEYPGYTTPIDELIERFKTEGIKVFPQKYYNGDFYILPGGSDNIEKDGVSPQHFYNSGAVDDKLRKLISKIAEFKS